MAEGLLSAAAAASEAGSRRHHTANTLRGRAGASQPALSSPVLTLTQHDSIMRYYRPLRLSCHLARGCGELGMGAVAAA